MAEREKIELTDKDRQVLAALARRGPATVGLLQAVAGAPSYVWLCGRLHRLARAGLVDDSARGAGIRLADDVAVTDSGWVGLVAPLEPPEAT